MRLAALRNGSCDGGFVIVFLGDTLGIPLKRELAASIGAGPMGTKPETARNHRAMAEAR